jgi:G-patch domain
MLQRAGWKEGEGLGKDKEGTSAPGNVPQRSVMLLVPATFLQTEVVFCVCVCVLLLDTEYALRSTGG